MILIAGAGFIFYRLRSRAEAEEFSFGATAAGSEPAADDWSSSQSPELQDDDPWGVDSDSENPFEANPGAENGEQKRTVG